ncbi:uncharacterized protein LOC119866334 isoform X2 [Canis lupus familiaris]|uniref:uncharacterized protein LOC119866334 isoform X2 n=1 Tax=Canis lupus familiaris TaxID=9615 RepID=UPI0015F18438|nr:uncharacterized protein LOC119866334 isoform X2 [Canis lupus familiaris]XP_038315422.1 uncharacterized protein LOC119866334 isoform X2 [Canis lupus familiaris]XP_038432033.1 uncharacterized protein LOC119866334 isoform X2 [Canis lupus familiaris]
MIHRVARPAALGSLWTMLLAYLPRITDVLLKSVVRSPGHLYHNFPRLLSFQVNNKSIWSQSRGLLSHLDRKSTAGQVASRGRRRSRFPAEQRALCGSQLQDPGNMTQAKADVQMTTTQTMSFLSTERLRHLGISSSACNLACAQESQSSCLLTHL